MYDSCSFFEQRNLRSVARGVAKDAFKRRFLIGSKYRGRLLGLSLIIIQLTPDWSRGYLIDRPWEFFRGVVVSVPCDPFLYTFKRRNPW